MSKVAVFNDNVHPYKEVFREKTIEIPPKGHVMMEHDEAVMFLGTMVPPKLGADNEHLPEGFKMLRIIKKKDLEKETKPEKIKCHSCGKEFADQASLDDHIVNEHLDQIEDEEVAKDLDRKAYDRKVLKDYLREDGRIEQLPTNRRKLDVILRYIAEHFDFGKIYTEKQVNEVIGALNEDISGLRRDLISVGYLERKRDGSEYWRVKPVEG